MATRRPISSLPPVDDLSFPIANPNTPEWMRACVPLVRYLLVSTRHRDFTAADIYDVFYYSVNTELQDYTQHCPEPISFTQIMCRIARGEYGGAAVFYEDVICLLDNCYTYNITHFLSDWGKIGLDMERRFLTAWQYNPMLRAAAEPRAARQLPVAAADALVDGGAQEFARNIPRIGFSALLINRRLGSHLGRGSFGSVFRTQWQGVDVAVKKLLERRPVARDGREIECSIYDEANLLDMIGHPNVLALYGVCVNPACLVTEYCSRGSLFDLIENVKSKVDNNIPNPCHYLGWSRRIAIALDVARGMRHLHEREVPILHRDLRSPNLLIAKDNSVKVADFGQSKQDAVCVEHTNLNFQNPRWLAPELLRGERASRGSDVFSFGVVLFEIFALERPWNGMNDHAIVEAVVHGNHPDVPTGAPFYGHVATPEQAGAYLAIMRQCWAYLPQARPSFKTIEQRLLACALRRG
jgi:hypothetical protein